MFNYIISISKTNYVFNNCFTKVVFIVVLYYNKIKLMVSVRAQFYCDMDNFLIGGVNHETYIYSRYTKIKEGDYTLTLLKKWRKDLNKEFYLRHWYADIYEQQVIQQNEIDFILKTVGNVPKKILEVACGGGRISEPLARAGHKVIGFDFDEFMLEKAIIKSKGLHNISYFKADAVYNDWGRDFDIVILAGNILLNIESDMDYRQSQQLFIEKAANSVKQGGHMYLDFDCFFRPDKKASNKKQEWVCFEGTDNLNTYGKYIVINGDYDSQTCISTGFRRYEITPENSNSYSVERIVTKHFPNLNTVKSWLEQSGWEIEYLYGGYDRQPIDETVIGNRAIIWAKKL